MPSHLTHVVFRSIIANEPLLYRGCLHRSSRLHATLRNAVGARPRPPQRRTFFNLLKPQRKTKSAELPHGFDKLAELVNMQRVAARPPAPDEVAQAFNVFASQKHHRFEDFHAQLAANAFIYLQAHPRPDSQPWLSDHDILKVFERLEKPPAAGGGEHLRFARLLREELSRRRERARPGDTQEVAVPDSGLRGEPGLSSFLRILCLYGASVEARDIIAKAHRALDALVEPVEIQAAITAWTGVLRGFAHEGNRNELLRTAETMRELSIPFVRSAQDILVVFLGATNDLEQAKRWYLQPLAVVNQTEDASPSGNTYAAILKACALGGDMIFGQQVVASLLKNMPNKPAWDAVFLWSAAIGKGVDEVDRMMNVMVRRNEEARQKDASLSVMHPDIDTINALVEFSIAKQDPYSAERYIALGEKRGISPNATTCIMQMQYRLSVKDIDGARAAYLGLQGAKDENGVEAINKLVRAMCELKQHHFDDIMAIVDDLHDHKARLDPETVATICLVHLRRGEMHDAIDLIQVHAHHYSPAQRRLIREMLVGFLLDRQNSTADAWDTYQTLRKLFPETPRDVRAQIMNEFFVRQRSDMACHVFFHMRNHTHEAIAANRDVYVAAFTGFARSADAESLELAHNQLKLDLKVELDTKLRSSLMLAYAATGNNLKALSYWSDIVASREGPTYNSIAIAFRSCEGLPFGDQHAKPIWRRLREMDIDIDPTIFTAYLGAIARNQLHDEAVAMLETVEEEYGFEPDLSILGNWFNTTTNIDRQAKVEAWIRSHYPNVWTEMDKLGYWVTMDGFGYRQYHINRDLDP